MRRSSIIAPLFATLAAALALSCNRDVQSGAPASTASASATAAASTHPPPENVPPTEPLDLPEAESVPVPNDYDPSPADVQQTTVRVPGSDPAPDAPLHPAPLPKTHLADAKPFECLSHDECYFPRMPFYNQANPNLAHVVVPKGIYDEEQKGKVSGPMVWDGATNGWAVMLKPKTTKVLDPYYNTWLPFGPASKKDDGSIGYLHTMLCGPTAESMALMAAWAAKGPKSKAKAGSWTERFIAGQRPEAQAAVPTPLLRDHSNLSPTHADMTVEDIQRVINMAVRQRTNPIGGGGDDAILHLGDDFELADGKSPVETRGGGRVTNEMIMNAVRDGFASVIVAAGYKASVKPVSENGKVVKYTMTFERNMGHVLAVNGFSMDPDGPSILIYNPFYAAPTRKRIVKITTTGAKRDGVPLEVKGPEGGDYLSILHEISEPAKRPVTNLDDITDGLEVYFFDGFSAVKLD